MKITQKQLLILWGAFKDTLSIMNRIDGISQKDRVKIANIISEQQGDKIIEVKSPKNLA